MVQTQSLTFHHQVTNPGLAENSPHRFYFAYYSGKGGPPYTLGDIDMPTSATLSEEDLVDDLISKLKPQSRIEESEVSFPPTGSKYGPPTPEAESLFPESGDKSGTAEYSAC